MKDSDFDYILGRVENNHPDRYIGLIQDYREWLNAGESVGRESKTLEETKFVDIEDYLNELDDYYSNASSVKRVKSALVAFYKEWNKLRRTDRFDGEMEPTTPPELADYEPDTTDTLKAQQTREDVQYLDPSEVADLNDATERHRDSVIIRLLFQTGIRVSELISIRLDDIQDPDNRILIRGKGRKNRPVYYQDNLQVPLDVWRDEYRPALYYAEESEYLFPTSHSPQITRQTVAEVVREAADKAGLQDTYDESADGQPLHTVTPHVLRHSFAMAALDNGWDIYDISRALGHEETETTASMYLHDDDDRTKRNFQERGVSSLS